MTPSKKARQNWVEHIESAIDSLEAARDSVEAGVWEDVLAHLDDADHLAGLWLELHAIVEGKPVKIVLKEL